MLLSVLYLNTLNKEFKGAFVFFNRVISFTSGEENRHQVEKVAESFR